MATKIPDFQPIFNVLSPKCFASGALPEPRWGGTVPQTLSWETFGHTFAEGPTQLRAPGPRNATIRHWLDHIPSIFLRS